MLALSFLLMIGMTLIADGFGYHIERGYIYAAMFFSSLVEALNTLARRKARKPHDPRLARSFSPPSISRRSRRPDPGSRRWSPASSPRGSSASRHSSWAISSATWSGSGRRDGPRSVANAFAGVFVAIKFAGAAYLLYLAWRIATAPATPWRGAAAGLAWMRARSSARCR